MQTEKASVAGQPGRRPGRLIPPSSTTVTTVPILLPSPNLLPYLQPSLHHPYLLIFFLTLFPPSFLSPAFSFRGRITRRIFPDKTTVATERHPLSSELPHCRMALARVSANPPLTPSSSNRGTHFTHLSEPPRYHPPPPPTITTLTTTFTFNHFVISQSSPFSLTSSCVSYSYLRIIIILCSPSTNTFITSSSPPYAPPATRMRTHPQPPFRQSPSRTSQ